MPAAERLRTSEAQPTDFRIKHTRSVKLDLIRWHHLGPCIIISSNMRLLVASALGVGLPLSAASCFYGYDEPGSRQWTDRSPEVGSIGFKLTMPSNVTGDSLDYRIAGPGAYQKVGNLPFSVDERTFAATISDIPL